MQFRREDAWLNLNGTWDFRIDRSGSARERGIVEKKELFDKKIVVPFCPESKLSGVADVDFMQDVWYRREVTFPKAWAGKRIFLRFGGVDFLAEAWLDGKNAGSHNGGSAPFALDVTDLAKPGAKQVLVVHAHDETRGDRQGEGKQSGRFFSAGCHYTRVTGIWQTVWAEAVPPQGLAACRTTPNLDTSEVVLEPRFLSVAPGDRFRAVVRAGGEVVAERDVPAVQGAPVSLAIPDVRPWSPSDPFLYDLTLTVERGGKPVDAVESYFAMRKVSCEGNRVLLNGRPVFLRFVLDQGFYPDGVWTAPSDAELKADIERSMAAGFNGARLHQKVFEDRWHYWADRLGYLTWAEYPSWGFNATVPEAQRNFLEEWQAVVAALRDHPSIVGWSPLNESTGNGLDVWNIKAEDAEKNPRLAAYRRFAQTFCDLTKAIDPTRPVNDASGYVHWTARVAPPEEGRPPDRLERPRRRAALRGGALPARRMGRVQVPAARRPQGRHGLGLQRPVLHEGGGLPRPHRRADEALRLDEGAGRLVLHAAHGRRAGAERRLHLRPPPEGRAEEVRRRLRRPAEVERLVGRAAHEKKRPGAACAAPGLPASGPVPCDGASRRGTRC